MLQLLDPLEPGGQWERVEDHLSTKTSTSKYAYSITVTLYTLGTQVN